MKCQTGYLYTTVYWKGIVWHHVCSIHNQVFRVLGLSQLQQYIEVYCCNCTVMHVQHMYAQSDNYIEHTTSKFGLYQLKQ